MRHRKGEALTRVLAEAGLEPGRLLMRRGQTTISSAGNMRRASSIACSGLTSPTWAATCSAGSSSEVASARSVASARASSSAFVSRSSQEIFEAGASPTCPVRPTPPPPWGRWRWSLRRFGETTLSVEPAGQLVSLRGRCPDCLRAGRADRVRGAQARVDRVQRSIGRKDPRFRDPYAAAPGAVGNQFAAIEQCPDFREEGGGVLGVPGRSHRPFKARPRTAPGGRWGAREEGEDGSARPRRRDRRAFSLCAASGLAAA
jgi:hypothetical protein